MPEVLSKQNGDVLIAQFTSQRLFDDSLIAQAGRELSEIAEKAAGGMILDFQGVMFMSSSMIGQIVVLNKKCRASNTEIRMCNLAPSIMEVFEITRLNKVFKICASAEDALTDFGQPVGGDRALSA
ncbi:MAG: STAS domain-containing protein [Planctomycetes bacterium]|nr:STAS domain-containing protein [Planctomycetota bacterium]MBL7041042.1 STAS domain-containing protein [Pirellulaceae bacterium]